MTPKQKLNNLIDQLSPSEQKVLCDYIQGQYAVNVKEKDGK